MQIKIIYENKGIQEKTNTNVNRNILWTMINQGAIFILIVLF